MERSNLQCTAAEAWTLFWQLAEEQQDLALLISAKLPRAVLRQLQISCSTMRRLVNAGVSCARVDAGSIEEGPLLGDVFPALRDFTLRQARNQLSQFKFFNIDQEQYAMRDGRFREVAQRQLIGTQLGRQLETLRVLHYLDKDGNLDDKDIYPKFLSICTALPRLRSFRISGPGCDWLRFCEQPPAPAARAAPAGAGLTDLYVDGNITSDVAVAPPAAHVLQPLRCLRWEVLSENGQVWPALAALPNLTRLDLRACTTIYGIVHLAALQHLRELALFGEYTGAGGSYAELAHLTQLTWLRLWDEEWPLYYRHGWASALTALSALRHLEIWDGTLAREGLALFALPQLTHLACAFLPPGYGMPDEDEDEDSSQQWGYPQDVTVSSSLRSLRVLTVSVMYDDDGHSKLEPWAGLMKLQFTAALTALAALKVRSGDLNAAVLTQLRSLELENPSVGDAGFASIVRRLTGLQSLTLSSSFGLVGDDGMRAVSVLTQLTRVYVRDASAVGDAGLVPLTCLQRLRSVGWEECPCITLECIDAFLASHPQLRCRMWGYQDMSPKECRSWYAANRRHQVELLTDDDR